MNETPKNISLKRSKHVVLAHEHGVKDIQHIFLFLLSPALWPSQTSLFLVNLDFCNCIGLSSRSTGAWHQKKWELNFFKLFRVHLPAALGSLAVDWHISWLFLKKQPHWILNQEKWGGLWTIKQLRTWPVGWSDCNFHITKVVGR